MMSFYGVVSITIYINTKYAVYNGWEASMLYIRNMYGGH